MTKIAQNKLSIASFIISIISLLFSFVIGINQLHYYYYNIRTNYSVRVKILSRAPLEIYYSGHLTVLILCGGVPDMFSLKIVFHNIGLQLAFA